MKFLSAIIFITVLSINTHFAQEDEGIQFFQGTWKEVLAEAKAQNKLVFVDVSATWCKPCKMMEKMTFTKKEVGEYFNKNFINYKIVTDQDKIGNAVADKFKVKGMPTYLFVDGDENLRYFAELGYVEAEELIQAGKNALNPKKQLKIKKKK